MIEIERKYLVTSSDFLKEYSTKNEIAQGYLCSNPERTVRIRIKGNKGKGKMDISAKKNGNEWEYKKIKIRIKEPKEEIHIINDTIE